MKIPNIRRLKFVVPAVMFACFGGISVAAQGVNKPVDTVFDAPLAAKLGADAYGMKSYVLVFLKTGPKDAEFKGKERDAIFAGHLANIKRLGDEGKLAVAGPFGKNTEDFRGLFIFNVTTVEEAKKLVDTDPTVKASVLVPVFVPWYGTAALVQVNETHKKIAKQSY